MINKKDVRKRLKAYVRAMKYYSRSESGSLLKMESRRYFEDNFTPEERRYVKLYCPILVRLRLFLLGANIF